MPYLEIYLGFTYTMQLRVQRYREKLISVPHISFQQRIEDFTSVARKRKKASSEVL